MEMPHRLPSLFYRIRESQQREVLYRPGEEVSTDEDGADHEGPRELPELFSHEAAHPTLKLWHLCHPGSQGPGVPRLCPGELWLAPRTCSGGVEKEEDPSPRTQGWCLIPGLGAPLGKDK